MTIRVARFHAKTLLRLISVSCFSRPSLTVLRAVSNQPYHIVQVLISCYPRLWWFMFEWLVQVGKPA